MDFISWAVFGILFILAETAIGSRHALAIGLAFLYPAIADLTKASLGIQLTVLLAGALVHLLIVTALRRRPGVAAEQAHDDLGQRVEVLEWLDECTARVSYRGREWEADKVRAEMPDADSGIIRAVQYGRLVISTERADAPVGK
ncbi:hypothetical protein [Ferriphaselus sp. R-1]|uniref:NfeD family protein n=1 Tax=Ferriphaselus sp. R-1 TaxID=1485544 RepID=UPI000554808B|nr:hypothetical protein [Ferriphaselus sp. R-1]